MPLSTSARRNVAPPSPRPSVPLKAPPPSAAPPGVYRVPSITKCLTRLIRHHDAGGGLPEHQAAGFALAALRHALNRRKLQYRPLRGAFWDSACMSLERRAGGAS
jgi:hypothetical protein